MELVVAPLKDLGGRQRETRLDSCLQLELAATAAFLLCSSAAINISVLHALGSNLSTFLFCQQGIVKFFRFTS